EADRAKIVHMRVHEHEGESGNERLYSLKVQIDIMELYDETSDLTRVSDQVVEQPILRALDIHLDQQPPRSGRSVSKGRR
ncbi:UNVERIFIED_CONTAM: hypothetical protein IGO34_33470, partial [Salmonella enterica subsp. enterica serovar Weltevreden]